MPTSSIYLTVEKLMKILEKEEKDSLILISMTDEDGGSPPGMPVLDIFTGVQLGNRKAIMLVSDDREKTSLY